MYKEEELTKKAIGGDQDALVELLEYNRKTIFVVAEDILAERYSKEDLFQDIFVACITGIKNFRCESIFKTWVYEIARRQALKRLRIEMEAFGVPFVRDGYDKPLSEHDDVHYIEEPIDTDIEEVKDDDAEHKILSKLYQNERKIIVNQALKMLDMQEEAIIRRYYFDGVSFLDIADEQDLKYDTMVKRIRRKTYPKLKKILKDLGIERIEDI